MTTEEINQVVHDLLADYFHQMLLYSIFSMEAIYDKDGNLESLRPVYPAWLLKPPGLTLEGPLGSPRGLLPQPAQSPSRTQAGHLRHQIVKAPSTTERPSPNARFSRK